MIACGIFLLHEAFQTVHEAPPERLAPEERPVFELWAVRQREAREKVSSIVPAGFLEGAPIGGLFELTGVGCQSDQWRPSHTGAVRFENALAQYPFQAMKHTPQARAGGLVRALRPQQAGRGIARQRALILGQIDQQRQALAQDQLYR